MTRRTVSNTLPAVIDPRNAPTRPPPSVDQARAAHVSDSQWPGIREELLRWPGWANGPYADDPTQDGLESR